MKAKLFQNAISVRSSPLHGYGVFAEKDIKNGEIVEECYALLTSERQDDLINFYFKAGDKSALPTGYGCIYNHSDTPSLSYQYDANSQTIIYKAVKLIKKDEEIFISYGKDWFDSRDLLPIKVPYYKKLYYRYFALSSRLFIIFIAYFSVLFLLKYFAS